MLNLATALQFPTVKAGFFRIETSNTYYSILTCIVEGLAELSYINRWIYSMLGLSQNVSIRNFVRLLTAKSSVSSSLEIERLIKDD
jgi:hypothetical protein